MFRAITRFWLVPVLLLLGSRAVFGFALLGPFNEAYQVPAIGYNLGPPNFKTDLGAPKNIAQGYRYNVRNIYYAEDASFITYFGTNAQLEIDKAFATFNSLNSVDLFSPNLSEWPLNTTRINFAAAQLGMLDLKSITMELVIEQLGLAEPDRYAFTLHSRALPAGSQCPNFEYFVIQRNFDPITLQYSPFVNGVLYSYAIEEECAATPNPLAPALALTVPILVDPVQVAGALSAVSAFGLTGGAYYTGFTRDDVGGLRYLWSTNRIQTETVDGGSLLQAQNPPTLIITSNLSILLAAEFASSNAAQLQSNFPGLNITGSNFLGNSNVFITNLVVTTNIVPPDPRSIAGSQPKTNIVTNIVVSTSFQPVFSFNFGNLINPLIYLDTNGFITTNFAEYILTPANTCGFTILSNAGSVIVTNTNTSPITFLTNHLLAVEIPTCVASPAELREGMQKINFVRVDYSSFIGQTWGPVSNTFTLTAITNNHTVLEQYSRTVTGRPDMLFQAADLLGGPAALTENDLTRTAPAFNVANALPGLAGPGTITPGATTFVLNNVGPAFENQATSFLGAMGTVWGSFDGTTNAPVLYPTTATLQNLQNNIFLQITLSGLPPVGNVGQLYAFQLSATGATPPPYTWSLVPNTGGLPNGLHLLTSGVITGTPTSAGVFDVSIQVMDTSNPPRASQRFISIEIDP